MSFSRMRLSFGGGSRRESAAAAAAAAGGGEGGSVSASSRGGGDSLTAGQLESPTYSEVNNRSWNNEDEYNSEGSEGSDHHVQSPQASANEASTEAGLSETSTEEETPEERMEAKMRVELFEKSKDGDLAGVRGLLLALQVLSTERDESAVDYRDEDGMTILHWAAREGQQEVVDYLITSAGADVLDRDSKGLRASGHAREMYFMGLAKHLESKEFNVQHHISRLQSSLRRYAYRLEFIEKRSCAVRLESMARRAMVAAARGGGDLTPYTTMWFREGEEGRHRLAREVQRRVRGILERVRFVKKQEAGRCLAAVMRMRLGRMLFLGAKVFCGKGGQDRNAVITKMMGGHSSGWRKVTPLWRTREYLVKHETMRGIHGAGIEWHRMHATVRQTFMDERRELTNIKTRAVLKIQSMFRGVAARKRVEVLEAERALEREAALAQRGGKLFSMYSNGERAVTLYVEWSVEKEVRDAPERYRAIQERGGGVCGVSVLCIRATESLVRESLVREEAKKRREEQERVREARKREERQRVEHFEAAVRIQCFYRCIRAIRRTLRLKSLLPKRKRPDPMGQVIEQMQKDYARANLVLKETTGEWEDSKGRLGEARRILGEAQAVLVEVEEGIESCVRVRKAAIAGRRHKEAGRARAEWERLCLARERAEADIERMMPGMGEREAEAARLAQEVVLLGKDVKRRKHELDQFSYRKGRGRPPKHAGQLQAMVVREKRAVEGGSFGGSSEVEVEAALAVQKVLRGHWARLEVGTRYRFRHRWRHASGDELQKLGLVQAQARGWIVRKRVRVLMMEMAEAAERKREEAEMKEEEEEYWRVEHIERYRSGQLELGGEGQSEGVHSRLQALEKEESVSIEQRLSQGGWFMRRNEKDTPQYKQKQLHAWVKKANQLRKNAFARISKASGRVEGAATMLDEAAKMLQEAQALYEDAGEHGRQGRQATAALRRAIVDRKAKLASEEAKYQNRVDQGNVSILSILEPKHRHSAKDGTPLEPPAPSSPGPRHHGLTPSSPGGFGISDLPVSPVPHLSSPSGHCSQDADARGASASVGGRLDHLMNEPSLHISASGSRPTSEGGIVSTPRPPSEPRSARQPSSRGRAVVQSLESRAKQAPAPAAHTVSNQASGPQRPIHQTAPQPVAPTRHEVVQHLQARLTEVQGSSVVNHRYLGGDKSLSPRREYSQQSELSLAEEYLEDYLKLPAIPGAQKGGIRGMVQQQLTSAKQDIWKGGMGGRSRDVREGGSTTSSNTSASILRTPRSTPRRLR